MNPYACAALASLSIAFALSAELTAAAPLAAAAATSYRVLAVSDSTDCEAFQRWFARQPGSQLVLSPASDFYKSSVRPRKPDTVLNYSAFPLSHDRASWYKAMKHYSNSVGNGRCLSGFYDSARKMAVLYSQYGTASDLTVTTVSSAPAGLPIYPAPDRTRNGVRLGMTLEQVTAIDGTGTLSSSGRYRRITYNQDFKASVESEPGGKTKTAVDVTAYLGFLFVNGRLAAIDVGGGV
ncbi:MAG TPA: hypothetical protein VGX91_13790 [Candidatus Cybelea sp.]|nr:hypothetical protein [Candidatus Cybelea sp.]